MKKIHIIIIIFLTINIVLSYYKIQGNIELKLSQKKLDETQKELNKLIKNCKF